MGNVTLLLGGQKSGKSSAAAHIAIDSARHVVVIAPATAGDPEFAARIARHRADRPAHWTTIESFDLTGALSEAPDEACVIVDALDTWLLEVLTHSADSPPTQEAGVMKAIDAFVTVAQRRLGRTVIVAGQPGLGIVPLGAETRRYVDLHGLVTQRLAAASEAYLVLAGRLLPLEQPTPSVGKSAAAISSQRADSALDNQLDWAPAIQVLVGKVSPADRNAVAAAQQLHDALAKPPGSLGRLEEIAGRLAGIAGRSPAPVPQQPALLVAAGDHGVHAQGVTPWPQDVTATIGATIVGGRAACNAIARQIGASVTLLDVGMLAPVGADIGDRIRAGTGDITQQPAMSAEEATAAVLVGAQRAESMIADGADLIVLGEIGIANTTPSAAVIAALTGLPAAAVTGPGATSLPHAAPAKVDAVERAMARHGDDRDPIGLLASLGGLEHAALVGAILQAAAMRVPVLLDGVTTVAAALVATALAPAATDSLLAGHRSCEPGATAGLRQLGLEPILDLDMRLGEGTGGLLAVCIVQAAARILSETATLDDVLG